MSEDQANSMQDLEKVQQKIEDYKKILATLKNDSSLDERIKKLEKLTETIHYEQNTKIQKYEEEISVLSTQVDTLNHTVFTLTEKITTLMDPISQEKQPAKMTGTFPSLHKDTPRRGIPSFKQLQNLLTETQPIELEKSDAITKPPQTDTIRQPRQNSYFPKPTTKMPNLNQPSAKKRFSVKLTSMNNDSTHLKVSDPPIQEAINEIEESSNKELAIPEQKQLVEEPQPNNEQLTESPSKNNMSSSLLNFFRKN